MVTQGRIERSRLARRSLQLVADLFTAAGATRLVSMDLHAGQIQGFFNIPFDNLFAAPVILEFWKKELADHAGHHDVVIVSPDAGGVELVRVGMLNAWMPELR